MYRPVSTLTTPAMTTTPAVMYRVPRMALFRPPPVPVVFVVSTLHCQCGTALTITPAASQTHGPITAARATKQPPQKIAFQTFLRRGTAGQSDASCRGGFSDPGGVAAGDALPRAPMLVMPTDPSPPAVRCPTPA